MRSSRVGFQRRPQRTVQRPCGEVYHSAIDVFVRDGEKDLIAIDEAATQLGWFENQHPTWKRHVLAVDVPRQLNVDCETDRHQAELNPVQRRAARKWPPGAFGVSPPYQHRAAEVWFRPRRQAAAGREDGRFGRARHPPPLAELRPGGSRCSGSASPGRSCCGSPTGSSCRCCSSCRHAGPGSWPSGRPPATHPTARSPNRCAAMVFLTHCGGIANWTHPPSA